MIPNIPDYNETTDPDEHIDTYEWTMTSLKMDKAVHVYVFPCYIIRKRKNVVKSLQQRRYVFIKNFMQLTKVKVDANSIMECKQKEGDYIRPYYDRFMLEILNVPVHEELLVFGTFAQRLLPDPLSKKMKGTVPQSRDKIKYRVKKYLRQIEGDGRKEANLKAVTNTYIKHEVENSHVGPSH